MLKIVFTDIDGNDFYAENISSVELSRTAGAACDGIRINYFTERSMSEINRVHVYSGEGLVFNGYCDTQRETVEGQGRRCFVYARSSACLLTDNEAEPVTYNRPTAGSLCIDNAREFGFECEIEDIVCNSDYTVGKGTSRYSAVNDFVCGIIGSDIVITPDNKIMLPDYDSVISIDSKDIESEKILINRVGAVSRIDYKIKNDTSYKYHLKSRYLEQRGINRGVLVNVSSLPKWRQDGTVLNRLKKYSSNYNCIELKVGGFVNANLYSGVKYDSKTVDCTDGYYISEIVYNFDKNGEYTTLTLSKNIDLKEIRYVAE